MANNPIRYNKCTIAIDGVHSGEVELTSEDNLQKAIVTHYKNVLDHRQFYDDTETFELSIDIVEVTYEENRLLDDYRDVAVLVNGALLAVLQLDNRVHHIRTSSLLWDSYVFMIAMHKTERTNNIVKRLYESDRKLCDVHFFYGPRQCRCWSPSNNAAIGLLLDRNSRCNATPPTLKQLCMRALSIDDRKRVLPGIVQYTELTEKTRAHENTARQRNKRQRR